MMAYTYEKCESCGAKQQEKITCDVCGIVMPESGITLRQTCHCWSNDSVDGSGHAYFCSLECLSNVSKAKFNDCCNHTDEDDGWDFDIEGLTPQQLREVAKLLKESVKEME